MCCITYRDTLFRMSSATSVRLDAEALRALAQLEATGLSRSEAIRRAILDSAARLQRRAALAAEVAALEADEDDRREMLEVAALMDIMRAAG
jgi:predicted transcriptional regulator